MSSLKNAVHSTLANLLSTRLSDHGDIAADVYRTLRDEAALLLERQFISDALDVDPFELTRSSGGSSPTGEGDDENAEADNDEEKSNGGDDEEDLLEKKKNAGVIARVKEIMTVVSCTRTTTLEGYSSIQAVVQLKNDGKMDGVKDHVRLCFSFLREPQHQLTNSSSGDDVANEVIYADADNFFNGEEDSDDDCDVSGSEAGNVGVETGEEEAANGKNISQKKRVKENNNAKRKRGDGEEDTPIQQHGKKSKHPDGANKTNPNNGANSTNDASSNDGSTSNPTNDEMASNERYGKSDNNITPKTIVSYKIQYSVDNGKLEQLLGVDVLAMGEFPSVEEAIPLIDDGQGDDREGGENSKMEDDSATSQGVSDKDDDDGDKSNGENNNIGENKSGKSSKQSSPKDSKFEEIEMSDDDDGGDMKGIGNDDDGNAADRFGVSIDPENVVAFLDRTNMNLNDSSVFYFLMTFPFYEHEWDIAGFLVSALFDEGADEEDEMMDCDEGGDICCLPVSATDGCIKGCCPPNFT